VLAQFLVVAAQRERPIGLVAAYRANFQDQHAYLSVARFGSSTRSPAMMLGLALFLRYVFDCWSFRKLYVETQEFNYEQFASGVGTYFELEGRLREHSFYRGRHWDQLTLAIYRERWNEIASRLSVLGWGRDTRVMSVRLPPRSSTR
jgi:hypothetical protein